MSNLTKRPVKKWSEPPPPRRDPPIIQLVNAACVGEMIGVPTERWPGNCFHIAILCVERGCVQGKAVYGHYIGGVDERSPRFGAGARNPMRHHGWVETPDGRIYDPTHWCFGPPEQKPRVRITTSEDDDYDKGGNKVRAAFRLPPPKFDESMKTVDLRELDVELQMFVLDLLDDNLTHVTWQQAGWIVSAPLDQLGDFAEPLYKWAMGFCPALIPLDNRIEVLGK